MGLFDMPVVQSAGNTVPPAFLLQDATECPGYSMSSYWTKKLNEKQGEMGK